MNNFGLPSKIEESILAILRRYKAIKKVVIFGSRANNSYKVGSDIDLAVWYDGPKTVLTKLYSDFEESTIPYFFDIVDYTRITNAKLRHAIDQDGKIFYQSDTARSFLAAQQPPS